MPKTHAQLMREVEALKVKIAQGNEAVDHIRRLARQFRLRAENIFPVGAWPGDAIGVAMESAQSQDNVVELAMPPYSDGKGNVWHGRGRRPKWLGEALASGLTLRDLMVKKHR